MKFKRSKYNFQSLNVGDTFEVAAVDLYSMKESARSFNKRHGRNLKLEILGEEKKGKTYKIKVKTV